MKAVDHAAERLASLTVDPFTEAVSVQALRLLSRGLPRVREAPGDLPARLDCQTGMAIALAAGPGAGVGVGAGHAIVTCSAATTASLMAIPRASCFRR